MAAALECWSSRATNTEDQDMVEQVLMRQNNSSEAAPLPGNGCSTGTNGGIIEKKLQKLSKNISEAIASVKNSLNLDSVREPASATDRVETCRKHVWGSVVRNLTQLYPGSQLPEKLVCNIRKHYDSFPVSYGQARFEMKDVFLHIRLIEQASAEDHPAIMIQEVSDDEVQGSIFKLTFAFNASISWPAMSGALDSASICCKKIQIFEKKGFTLGVVMLLVQFGKEKMFKACIENVLKSAVKKPKSTSNKKLPFGLCGSLEESTRGREYGEIEEVSGQPNYRNGVENSIPKVQLQMPLPNSSFIVSVDEWQTVLSGGKHIGRWLLISDNLELIDQIGPNTFKGVYKGKRVAIEKLKRCDKGIAYDFVLRKDLLELMTCGHKSILQFFGVCISENHGLCVLTKLMEGGSVHDLLRKNKKLQTKEIMRIATDIAEGTKFMNDHTVAYRDLNTQRILLGKYGNACLGDMGIVAACRSVDEAMEYETDGYRWLAPEIIAGDPESVTETWMSNVYSFGIILWELVACEVAYSAYSPVQAAVGIAACGLRPEIPKSCPQVLSSLMIKCWNSCPSKRPQFAEILSTLVRSNSNGDSY